jgi:hypothetical protein
MGKDLDGTRAGLSRQRRCHLCWSLNTLTYSTFYEKFTSPRRGYDYRHACYGPVRARQRPH